MEAASAPSSASVVTAPPRGPPNEGPGPALLLDWRHTQGRARKEPTRGHNLEAPVRGGVKGIKVKYDR